MIKKLLIIPIIFVSLSYAMEIEYDLPLDYEEPVSLEAEGDSFLEFLNPRQLEPFELPTSPEFIEDATQLALDTHLALNFAITRHIYPNEKPFKCDHPDCDYATAHKRDLTTHQRNHTGEKSFKCDHPGCEYAASRKGNLTEHKRKHTGDLFKCNHPECDYKTTYKSNLTTHQRKHTGDLLKCDHPGCNFKTIHKSALTIHQRIDTGEKPFKCDQCNYASTQKYRLISHQIKHTGGLYRCEICNFLVVKAFLTQHKKAHHKKGTHSLKPSDTINALLLLNRPHKRQRK